MRSTSVQLSLITAALVIFPAFLMLHEVLVVIDYDACFGNIVASVNGERPYPQVSEMSWANIISATVAGIRSYESLVMLIFGALTFLPFMIAWWRTGSTAMRNFWTASAMMAFAIIMITFYIRPLSEFYACDRKGVSISIALLPITFSILSSGFVLVTLLFRWLFLMLDRPRYR